MKQKILHKYSNLNSSRWHSSITEYDSNRVQQNQRDDTDINALAEKYGRNVLMANNHPPRFGDNPAILDLQYALNLQREAEQQFNQLPAKTRLRFNNNPLQCLQFVENPKNYQESVKLGLITPTEPEASKEAQAPNGEAGGSKPVPASGAQDGKA